MISVDTSLPHSNSSSTNSNNLVFKNVLYAFKSAFFPIIWPLEKVSKIFAKSILTTCIFQEASFHGTFSKNITMPLTRVILNTWYKSNGFRTRISFDKKRYEKSKNFLKLFADEKIFRTENGSYIKYMIFKSKKFKSWIEKNGGIIKENPDHLLVTPKDEASWTTLKNLTSFKCFEEKEKSIILPKPIKGAEKKYIFRILSFGKKIPLDKRYIGLHLATGFNYIVFNWGKKPSLKTYFEDAENVFEKVKDYESFKINQIIALGSCRASFVISNLMQKYQKEGLESTMIYPVPSLKSSIEMKSPFIKKIGLLGLSALEDGHNLFDNLKILEPLPKSKARTLIILADGDKTLPANTEEVFKNSIKNSPITIWKIRNSQNTDPHFSDPFLEQKNFFLYANFLVNNKNPQKTNTLFSKFLTFF